MTHALSLSQFLQSPLHLGQPSRFESLTLFPVLGPEPRISYRSLDEALYDGASVQELDDASVNDVRFKNTGKLPTLLFDGEGIEGAQQDRVIDGTRLVPAGATVSVPVCCVESGRWDHTQHEQSFSVADHVASPDVRACMKTTQRTNVQRRADQGQVWASVQRLTATHGVRLTTGAFSHVVDARRETVEALVEAVTLVEGQLGWLVFSGQDFLALDAVSRPDAWCDLSPRLLRGYALGIESGVAGGATRDEANAQLERLSQTPLEPSAAPHPTDNPKKTIRPEVWSAAKIWGVSAQVAQLAAPYRPVSPSAIEGSVLAAPDEVLAVSMFAA